MDRFNILKRFLEGKLNLLNYPPPHHKNIISVMETRCDELNISASEKIIDSPFFIKLLLNLSNQSLWLEEQQNYFDCSLKHIFQSFQESQYIDVNFFQSLHKKPTVVNPLGIPSFTILGRQVAFPMPYTKERLHEIEVYIDQIYKKLDLPTNTSFFHVLTCLSFGMAWEILLLEEQVKQLKTKVTKALEQLP